jgi:hypothetical protein
MKPILEVLEDRTAPADLVTFHGGPQGVLSNAQIVNINAAPENDQAAQFSPQLYNGVLGQYGAGIAGLQASYTAPPIRGTAITDAQVSAALSAFIKQHPPITGQEIYIWYLSPSQYLADGSGGWHGGDMAVVAEQSTYVETHEILEAVTDYQSGQGWYGPQGPDGGEIGDLGGAQMWRGLQVCVPVNCDGTLAVLPPDATEVPSAQPQVPANPLMQWFVNHVQAAEEWLSEMVEVEVGLWRWEMEVVGTWEQAVGRMV